MPLSAPRVIAMLLLGLLGWALCGAIMFVGMSVTTLQTTLVVHAVGAPVIFGAISWFFFTKLRYTTPLQTAALFVLIVIFMDFFLVSLVINRSLEMFESLLGTWIPFALIFMSTYLTGVAVRPSGENPLLPGGSP